MPLAAHSLEGNIKSRDVPCPGGQAYMIQGAAGPLNFESDSREGYVTHFTLAFIYGVFTVGS